jgi:nucleoside 2-deoxyribosyltransferase
MYNPFYRMVKADDIPDSEIPHVFVPEASSVWQEVQEPVNQMILGPRGAGKTILMKQLSYVNTLQGDTSEASPYLGIYVQISRLSNIFRHLFESNTLVVEERYQLEGCYQDVFADYLCSEILRELTKGFEKYFQETLSTEEIQAITGKVENISSSAEALKFCNTIQESIEKKFGDWQLKRYCDWVPRFEIGTSVDRMARAIESISLKRQSKPLFVYLLLDESCSVPEKCQEVANVLLQRGRSFKTKLAVRPYEWVTLETKLGVEIEEGNDFRKLQIEYPDELTDEYIGQMSAIANRILETQVVHKRPLPQGWPKIEKINVEDIFATESQKAGGRYSGFKDICVLSSGNPQNLLSICSAVFSSANESGKLIDGEVPCVPPDLQHQAMAAWSKDKFHEISSLDIRELCRALLNQVVKKEGSQTVISFHATPAEPSLFGDEVLPEDVGKNLKPGFGSGILRFLVGTRIGLWEVSAKFAVTRTLLPCFNIPLHTATSPPLVIDYGFIRRYCKERPGGKQHEEKEKIGEQRLSAFLSTSFRTVSSQDRKSIKEALEKVGIECRDLEDRCEGQFLFSAILRSIKACDITVLNATVLRPYTLFEIGLCAGLDKPKPVVCVINDEGKSENVSKMPDYLRQIPIKCYSIRPERLAEMAAKVRAEAEYLLTHPSEFKKVAETGTCLRPRRAGKTLYISFPKQEIWVGALPKIREDITRKLKYRVVTEDDVGIYLASHLQKPIYCANLAGLAVVDTSGDSEPDLLQCYKLGVVCARPKWSALRIERYGQTHKGELDALPTQYLVWEDVDGLIEMICNFVKESVKKQKCLRR